MVLQHVRLMRMLRANFSMLRVVHKMGMVLDSVQNDVMQLNRAMKEASLDCKLPIISTLIIRVSITTETFVHEFCT
jgi:hypothetical protein